MPSIARFTQQDPNKGNIYNPPSLNPYIHCYNNPLRWVDLDGRSAVDAREALGADIYEILTPTQRGRYYRPP